MSGMICREFSFPSATGVCDISACAYLPETEVHTVLVIHHGMAEHMERYMEFISFLCYGFRESITVTSPEPRIVFRSF
jgi:hypothetical protein